MIISNTTAAIVVLAVMVIVLICEIGRLHDRLDELNDIMQALTHLVASEMGFPIDESGNYAEQEPDRWTD